MDLNIHPEISTTVVNKPSKGLLNILDYQHMVSRLQEKKYPKESTRLFFFQRGTSNIRSISRDVCWLSFFKNTVLISIHIHFFKDQYTFYIKNNRQSVYTTHKHLNPNFKKFVDCSASLKVKRSSPIKNTRTKERLRVRVPGRVYFMQLKHIIFFYIYIHRINC